MKFYQVNFYLYEVLQKTVIVNTIDERTIITSALTALGWEEWLTSPEYSIEISKVLMIQM